MRTLNWVGKSVVVAMCLAVSSAQAGGIACAVDDVLQNEHEATIKVNDYPLTIKPVEMVEKGKHTHTLLGEVHHRTAAGKVHQMAYRVTKEKGAIAKIEVQTDGGMWFPISAEMTRALGDFTKPGPIPEKKQNATYEAIQKAANDGGSWQRAAELIVAYVAIRHC
jgi:hypothetical protein